MSPVPRRPPRAAHTADLGPRYDIALIPGRPPCEEAAGGDGGLAREVVVGGAGQTLSGRPARLPRVVLTALGTGRYRQMAIDAIESAVALFGGDCEAEFYVLTDNVTGVAPHLNPTFAPYRQWPESGLKKFFDIRNGLRDAIADADYFYFMDADVRFKETVELADIAGDLVGVEHPMYPRYEFGMCKKTKDGHLDKNSKGFCQYPYERKPISQAYIPESQGRYIREEKCGAAARRAPSRRRLTRAAGTSFKTGAAGLRAPRARRAAHPLPRRRYYLQSVRATAPCPADLRAGSGRPRGRRPSGAASPSSCSRRSTSWCLGCRRTATKSAPFPSRRRCGR